MSSVLASASMSSPLNEHQIYQPDSIIDPSKLTLNHPSSPPAENGHLSPYSSYRNNFSASASPSLNNQSTPGELISDNGCSSELSDYDDEFFGVDFGAGEEDISAALSSTVIRSPSDSNYGATTVLSDIEIKHTSSSTLYTHPLSPVDTETPSRQSSTISDHLNDLKLETSIPQYGLDFGNSPKSYENTVTSSIPIANLHPTPDRSNSSQGSLGSRGHISMYPPSPRVTVSQWGSTEDVEMPGASLQGLGVRGVDPLAVESSDDEEQSPRGRSGLSPHDRELLGDSEIPNFSEQELMDRIRTKNAEILSWRTRAASVGGDEPSQSTSFGLGAPNDGSRRRAKSTGAVGIHNIGSLGADINKTAAPIPTNEGYQPPADGWESRPATPRENKLIEGQIYINPNAAGGSVGAVDLKLIQNSPRHWNDAPAYPYITESRAQPPTSNEAMARFNQDNFSQVSRAATWGTRRKSEPSVQDLELFADGSLFKKLSLGKGPKKDDKPRQGSLFIRAMQSKRSHAAMQRESPLKQKNDSSSSLAPPSRTSSFGKKSTPSLNTAIAAMAGSAVAIGSSGHARSGSFSNMTTTMNQGPPVSPKSPFGFVETARTAIKRVRSKSDLNRAGPEAQSSIAALWKGLNGPPVPTLSSPAVDPSTQIPGENIEHDDDDDEEDQAGDYEAKVDLESPIIATKEGFQAHVRQLNPDMQHQFLIERIAHQQMVRYKTLLSMKVRHLQAVHNRDCTSGKNCMALGGTPTLLESKNPSRKTGAPATAFADESEDDSLPEEGLITPDTFPPGVPMPPTQHLPAEFECQLCFKVKKFQKPSDWTKHVHEDVQPFTCTYANCKEPKSFKRKADWVRHENERHRHLEWWTCKLEDCTHKCYRKDNFLQHLVREHKLPEPKQKTKLAIKKAPEEQVWKLLRDCHAETTNRPQSEPCKFCGKQLTSWKKLTVHLAKHMEHISLPILRLVEQKVVESDTIISPIEPQQSSRGPFTPNLMTKQESQGSNQFSDTISPNISTAGFAPYYPTSTSASQSSQIYNYPMQPTMATHHDVGYTGSSMYPNNPYGPHTMQSDMQSTGFTPISAHTIPSTYSDPMGNQPYSSFQVSNSPQSNPHQAYVGLGVTTAPPMAPSYPQPRQMMGGDVSGFGYQQPSNTGMEYTQMGPNNPQQVGSGTSPYSSQQGRSPSYPTSQNPSPQPPFTHSPQYPYHGQ